MTDIEIIECFRYARCAARIGWRPPIGNQPSNDYAIILGILQCDIVDLGIVEITDYYPEGSDLWYLWQGFIGNHPEINLQMVVIGRNIASCLKIEGR